MRPFSTINLHISTRQHLHLITNLYVTISRVDRVFVCVMCVCAFRDDKWWRHTTISWDFDILYAVNEEMCGYQKRSERFLCAKQAVNAFCVDVEHADHASRVFRINNRINASDRRIVNGALSWLGCPTQILDEINEVRGEEIW